MQKLIYENFGPAFAWVLQGLIWVFGGMSPLAAIGSLAALWWTIERARTERAKRHAIEGYAQDHPGLAKRMIDVLRTRPGRLDD